jgi:hypothetical protein
VQVRVGPGEGEVGRDVFAGGDHSVPGGELGGGLVQGEFGGEDGLDFGFLGEALFDLGPDRVDGAEGGRGDE